MPQGTEGWPLPNVARVPGLGLGGARGTAWRRRAKRMGESRDEEARRLEESRRAAEAQAAAEQEARLADRKELDAFRSVLDVDAAAVLAERRAALVAVRTAMA